jgi:hypothetical protein
MKRILLSGLLLLTVVFAYSQSQRLVLLEEFTQASCGPCATANPQIEALLNSNPNKITSVWYHTNWPGYDPMNLQNPTDVAARVSYYGVGYVPYSVLDGNYYSGSATGWNINTVNTRYAVPSPFTLGLQALLNSTQDTIFLTMVAEATMDVGGSLIAHNVVIEKNIHFATPPGSNGEKDFKNVMKKMLPTKDGTVLPSPMSPGDYAIIETSWPLANVYDINQLAAVAFVQNKTSKEVHQSVNSTTSTLVLPYDNDLQVMEVTNYSTTNCSGKVTPLVKIRNNGNDAVASFTVKYRVNDGPESTYTYSGPSMNSLQKTTLELPEYTFAPQANNILKVYSVEPNNIPDEYAKNDTANILIDGAPLTTDRLFLFVRTDNAPQESTWDVKNSSGAVIKSGGPYTLSSHTYRDTIYLSASDCYTFTIHDAGGNGLCCTNGLGVFQLVDDDGTVVSEGGSFGAELFNEFSYVASGITPLPMETGTLTITPNPSGGEAQAGFFLNRSAWVKGVLMNTFGEPVKTYDLGILPTGEQAFGLEAESLASGIYFLRMTAGNKVLTAKVSVTR